MKTLLLSFLFLFAGAAMAQNETIVPPAPGSNDVTVQPNDNVYTYVEQMPEFPGGENALMEFLRKNLHYPATAREQGVEGRVIVRFVVNEAGLISEISILRDIGSGCGAEAVRVVKMMPKWKPGKQNGKPVKTYYTLPVMFQLS
jgi:protein TonB